MRHRRSGFGKRSSRHPWSQPRETGQARASGPSSSASPVPAVFDDGWPLLCGSWGPECGHSCRSSSWHGHAVAEGPRLARTRHRTLGGLTWQKLMVSARRQSPESRGCVLLPVHCRLRDGHVVIFSCPRSSSFCEYLSLPTLPLFTAAPVMASFAAAPPPNKATVTGTRSQNAGVSSGDTVQSVTVSSPACVNDTPPPTLCVRLHQVFSNL